MVASQIALHDHTIQDAFNRFDTDSSGYITVGNLQEVFGGSADHLEVQQFIAEADFYHDGQISYSEFVRYVQGDTAEGVAAIGKSMGAAAAASAVAGRLLKGLAVGCVGARFGSNAAGNRYTPHIGAVGSCHSAFGFVSRVVQHSRSGTWPRSCVVARCL